MDPATIALVAAAGLQGAGQIMQSQAASAAAGYNAEVAANNSKIATQNAAYAGQEGEQNVAASQAKTRAQLGAIVANQGASGVDVNSGSNVAVQQSAAEVGMLNALNIRSEAARKAYGFQTEAVSYTGQSQLDRSQASADKTAGYINAGSTILGGAGKASQYNSFLSSNDPTGGITQSASTVSYEPDYNPSEI